MPVLLLLALVGCTSQMSGLGDSDGPGDIAAAALSNPSGGAAARVAWTPPVTIPLDPTARAGYVVGYEIYRSQSPGVSAVAAQLIAFVEGGHTRAFIDEAGTVRAPELVSLATDGTTGYVTVSRALGSGTPSITYGSDAITYDILSTPPSPGVDYYYLLRVVSKKLATVPFDPPNGAVSLAGDLVASVGYASPQATPLTSPTLVSPPDWPDPGSLDIDLSTALFEWEQSAGADSFCIELSTDRAFPAAQTVRSSEYLVSLSGGATLVRTFVGADLQEAFGDWTGPIYWRVGARRSSNGYRPVGLDGETIGYVFSAYRSLRAIDSPPGTP
jgi:hypothetical protein